VNVAVLAPSEMGDSTDDALAAAALADPNAFAQIYQLHRVAVFRFVRGIVSSDDDAAEVTAVTFERALRGLAAFRPMGRGLRPWLFRIARNAAFDELRRRRRVIPFGTDSGDRRPALSEVAAGQPSDLIELRRQLELLPGLQRDALLLRYAGGLTTIEIAAVIGKSEAATQKAISRALHVLKEALR
jgi:RNA polymerase sigma factor (sigma-70 family)